MLNLPLRLINLTPIQKQYYSDLHRFLVVSAGRRSRKTLIGARKVLLRALENPGKRYFHAAPTERQAKAIFWEGPHSGLLRNIPRQLIKKTNATDLYVKLLNNAEIHVAGLDKPSRIEGRPWDGCHITEMADVKPQAWQENIRPLLSDTNGFAILDGVPEGRNHYYDKALYAAGGAIPATVPLLGAYAENQLDHEWAFYSWFSSDVLSAAEIAAVKRELDERTYRQEYEGSFEGAEGLAYYAFSKDNLKLVQRNETAFIHIGMDFNVDPMTATLCEVASDTVNQWGEVYLRNSNTYEMAAHLKSKYDPRKCVIYPDATGSARESNATSSDIKILKDAGFTVKENFRNPRQRDRVNAVNGRLKSMSGQVRYFINPQTCPKTINDLNKMEIYPDGRLNKEQEKQGIGHISDALGYLVCHLFPLNNTGILTGR